MNKLLPLLLLLVIPSLRAEDIDLSSEVVDPLAPVEESKVLEADPVAEPVTEAAPAAASEATPEENADAAQVVGKENMPEEKPVEKVDELDEKVAEPELEDVVEPKVETAEAQPAPAPEPAKVTETPAPVNTSSAVVEEDDRIYTYRKGHWISTINFEALEYIVPMDFQGTRQQFDERKRNLWGGRMGFGREFYLGWGFNTSTRLEGFYMGTLFENRKQVDKEENDAITNGFQKFTGNIYGGEVVQTLGFNWELVTKNPFMDEMTHLIVEPFVFAGIGRARALNDFRYDYDNGTIQEGYQVQVKDDITSTSVGGGINFTARTGWFLTLKATTYQPNITKRRTQGYREPNGAGPTEFSNEDTDVDDVKPITIYALGGGLKF